MEVQQKNNWLRFLRKPQFILVATFISALWVDFNIAYWENEKVIEFDVAGYYGYLPSLFYHKDLSQHYLNDSANKQIAERYFYMNGKTPTGEPVFKYTMGMAFTYLPFFTLAHIYEKLSGGSSDGFSPPYHLAIQLSSLFYFLIGLFFLMKLLRRFFDDQITFFTMLLIVFATNVFYYLTVGAGMSHAVDFALVAAFMWHSIQWHEEQKLKQAVYLGLIAGLLVLIRPINILVIIFFLLYKVKSGAEFKLRISLFLKNKIQILLMAMLAFLVFLPQMIYWKIQTGAWLFNSYIGEHFFFLHPHIIDGFFSYRKGWLLYTPLMLFGLAGFYFLFKKQKNLFFPFILIFVLYLYVAFSWWCWWYGGSFGQRSLIDIYPIMAICLAAFLQFLSERKKLKLIFYPVLILLLLLNIFQTMQAKWNTIHYDSMTREAYWDAFLRLTKNPEREKYLKHPDLEKAKAGINEY